MNEMNERAIPAAETSYPTPEDTAPSDASLEPNAPSANPASDTSPAEQPRRYERPQMGNDIPISIGH